MKKEQFYYFSIVVLLISNILLIVFIFFGRNGVKPFQRDRGPKDYIINRLEFNRSQIDTFDKFIHWHQENIRTSDEKISILKSKLYTLISENGKTQKKDSIIMEIGKVQMEIENINFKHFQDIKGICKKKQIKKFEILSEELTGLFGRGIENKDKAHRRNRND